MSHLAFYQKFKEFEVWKFTPDLLRAFPFYLEPITVPWRVRCIFEYFVGYEIFYIKINEKWAGYCVVSSGRNRRYKFSTGNDIIYGRYYISEEFRGRHLALTMLRRILDDCGLEYEKAFAYLRNNNIASKKTMQMLGARERYRFDIRGLFRNKFQENENGDFVLFEYQPEREKQ